MSSTNLAAKQGREDNVGRAGAARVITGAGRRGGGLRYRDHEATSAGLFVAVGAGLALMGLIDLAILWTPVRFGIPAWEFATISRTFTNVPMTTVGLVLVVFGLVRRQVSPGWIRGAAVVFGVMAVILIVLALVYATAIPSVTRQVTQEASDGLTRAIVKNGAEILVYPTVLVALAVVLWRGVKKSEK